METKNYFSTDAAGNILPSATCYVYVAGTTDLATGLVNINGAPLSNPFTALPSGLVQFKAPDGEYDLRVTKAGRDFTIRIQCFDGIEFSSTGVTKKLSDYDALLNYKGPATRVYITQPGISGPFYVKEGSSATGNDGTIFVAKDGRIWLRDFDCNPCFEWWLVKSDGSDEGDKMRKALASKLTIHMQPNKKYYMSGGLRIAARQYIRGDGHGNELVALAGSYDILAFALSGDAGCGATNFRIDASAVTGGWAIDINHANSCQLDGLRVARPWNGLRITRANMTYIDHLELRLCRGEHMFLGDGTSTRSDIVEIGNLIMTADETISPELRPHGFTVDGNFNTIKASKLIALAGRSGIRHINSAGTTTGSFAEYVRPEIEYTYEDSVQLMSGQDITLVAPYIHGSKSGHGLVVGPNCGNSSSIGGKITGNWKRGVDNNGSDFRIVGTKVAGNSIAGKGQFAAVTCGATARGFNAAAVVTGLNDSLNPLTVDKSNQSYGFEVLAGARDCNWIGGDLRGNSTGEWIDSSGGVSGNVNVFGYAGDSADSYNQYSATVPADGGSFQILDNSPTLILNPAAALSSYTVIFPKRPKDGEEVRVSTKLAISSLTLNPGDPSHVINSKPTSMANGSGFAFKWRNSSKNWFRLY